MADTGDFLIGYGHVAYNNSNTPAQMVAAVAHEEFAQLFVALWQHTIVTPLPNATAHYTTTCVSPYDTVIFSFPLYFNQLDLLCEPAAKTSANGTIAQAHSFWCHKVNDRTPRPTSIVLPDDVGRTCRASPDSPIPPATLSCFTYYFRHSYVDQQFVENFYLPRSTLDVTLLPCDPELSPWLGNVAAIVPLRCAATNETFTFFLTTLCKC